ncbi:hypothetical protein ACX80D_14510 [Arthrobacter sp. Sr24]
MEQPGSGLFIRPASRSVTGAKVIEVLGIDDLRDPAASLFPYAPI